MANPNRRFFDTPAGSATNPIEIEGSDDERALSPEVRVSAVTEGLSPELLPRVALEAPSVLSLVATIPETQSDLAATLLDRDDYYESEAYAQQDLLRPSPAEYIASNYRQTTVGPSFWGRLDAATTRLAESNNNSDDELMSDEEVFSLTTTTESNAGVIPVESSDVMVIPSKRRRVVDDDDSDDDLPMALRGAQIPSVLTPAVLPVIFEGDRYIANSPAAIKVNLQKYGVAIVLNALTIADTVRAQEGMRDYLLQTTANFSGQTIDGYELHSPVDIDLPMTGASNNWRGFYALAPKGGMLLQNYGVGQTKFVWDVRQNPRVVDVFARVLNVAREDLLVSFDGVSLHLPPEVTRRGKFIKAGLHTDQRLTDSSSQCIQGLVNMYDTEEGDATFCFLEGSQNYHSMLKDIAPPGSARDMGMKKDWYMLSPSELSALQGYGCQQVRVKAPAGSLVLWDSRTIHCGVQSLPRPAERIKKRLAVYVSYLPRSRIAPERRESALAAKQGLFKARRMTSHWAIPRMVRGGFVTFPPKPSGQHVPRGIPVLDPKYVTEDDLTPLGRRLAGFDK